MKNLGIMLFILIMSMSLHGQSEARTSRKSVLNEGATRAIQSPDGLDHDGVFTGRELSEVSKLVATGHYDEKHLDEADRRANLLRVSQENPLEEKLIEFQDAQKTPFLGANHETYLLGETIWQRRYGDSEYFLAPTITDVSAYFARISGSREKSLDNSLPSFSIVRVALTAYTRYELQTVAIQVPDYYDQDTVLVMLPFVDINALMDKGIDVHFPKANDDSISQQPSDSGRTSQQIWFEGWEGSMSPYTIGYASGAAQAQWKDVNNTSFAGNWSLWCAGGGPQGQNYGTTYINNMNTHIYKTTGINVGNYSNVQFTFRIKYKTEQNYDWYRYLLSTSGASWTLIHSQSGTTSGWPNTWQTVTSDLTGTWNALHWRFEFTSDGSVTDEGVYLDNLEIRGDPATQQPNFVISPSSWNFGEVLVGQHVDKVFTITNTGGGGPGNVEIWTGEHYSIISGGGSFTLAAGGTRNVTVRFQPGSTGTKNDYLDVYGNGSFQDDASLTGNGVTPTLAVSPSSLSFGSVVVNTYSSPQSYTLTGSNLTGNVTVTAPSRYEVSLSSSSGYSSSLSITPSSGSVNRTIYVRFNPNANGTASGNVSNASTGATTRNVAVSGNGVTPTLAVSPSSLSFGNVVVNTYSSPQSYALTGSNLTGNVTVTAPDKYQVSFSSGSGYGSSLSITPSSGNVSQTIYVRFNPIAPGTVPGNVSNASTGVMTSNVAVSGTGVAQLLTISPTSQNVASTPGSFPISVSSNISWTVTSSHPWLTYSPSNGSNNATINVSYSANPSASPRTGTITATGGGITVSCVIEQAGSASGGPHFVKVWDGNGFQHMNFYVLTASVGNNELQQGDEIGIFDGQYCVGAILLNSPVSQYPNGVLPIIVSMNDPLTPQIDGYSPNNPVTFKIWNSHTQTEYSEPVLSVSYQYGNPMFVIGATAAVHLSANPSISVTPLGVDISIDSGILTISWLSMLGHDTYIVEASGSPTGQYYNISDFFGSFSTRNDRTTWSVPLMTMNAEKMFFRVRSVLD